MVEPILNKLELRRLPFQRRPIAEPGTTLVFQLPDGRLVMPKPPYTTGETFWKGPKIAYVVDVRPHGATFTCQLPSSGDALFFQATVNYSWSVSNPTEVVHHQVRQPEAECQALLLQRLPAITRGHKFRGSAQAEADVQRVLGSAPIPLVGRGLRIDGVYAHLRIDAGQLPTVATLEALDVTQQLDERQAQGKGRIALIDEENELARQTLRQRQMDEIIAGGQDKLYAFILQEDRTKGMEVLSRIHAMSERQEQRTLEAIKALIEGGEIRLGELDGAVSAAVSRISEILGKNVGLDAGNGDSEAGVPQVGAAPEADK